MLEGQPESIHCQVNMKQKISLTHSVKKKVAVLGHLACRVPFNRRYFTYLARVKELEMLSLSLLNNSFTCFQREHISSNWCLLGKRASVVKAQECKYVPALALFPKIYPPHPTLPYTYASDLSSYQELDNAPARPQ